MPIAPTRTARVMPRSDAWQPEKHFEPRSATIAQQQPSPEPEPVGQIGSRPSSAVVIRLLGGANVGGLIGIDTDRFTVGSSGRCEVSLPEYRNRGVVSRAAKFRRAPEGWMVHPHGSQQLYVNQERVTKATLVRAGDVLRFSPDGPEIQFLVQHQNQKALRELAQQYAPHLVRHDEPADLRVVPAAATDASSTRVEAWATNRGGTDGSGHDSGAYDEVLYHKPRASLLRQYGRTIVGVAALLAAGLIGVAAIIATSSGSGDSPPKVTPASDPQETDAPTEDAQRVSQSTPPASLPEPTSRKTLAQARVARGLGPVITTGG